MTPSNQNISHIFITDPFYQLQPGHDSTLLMMEFALKHGHQVWQAEMSGLFWEQGLFVQADRIMLENGSVSIDKSTCAKLALSQENTDYLVWMRKDPPVDTFYVRACQLLRLSKAPVLNHPDLLMSCDEKMLALEFPEWIPTTYVLQDMAQIKSLVYSIGKLIAKPIGQMGGRGILILHREDSNLASLVEILTNHGKDKIILQHYIPQAVEGDKRIFLVAGEPVGAILRVPLKGDCRANMAVGGSVEHCLLTSKEQKICNALKKRLLQLKAYIVGLDIIGEKLTEINLTSPTGLQEIAQFSAINPAEKVIQWAENFAKASKC